ncbi:TPA: hypothetical protein N0F65_006066 [Lagenidium giganteum]|uniref:5'-3' exonuclease domain-containing protein n=1 Tax=Lagenidium giganteum TaxID=4803 RepID=A0AAV2YNB2_9STRA|nr:TPA: hypothetical protein N0F65_006066 [Lagenidium giganteum]
MRPECIVAKQGNGAAAAAVERRRKSVLVDGNNMLYHFYNPLCSLEVNGAKSGAMEGLVRLLKRMDQLHRPQHMCVFFDSPRQKTVRHHIDPNYKRGRKPTPKSLRPQLQNAEALLERARVNAIVAPGFEADDLIASYTEALVARGDDVLVISNDNDFLQLARGGEQHPSVAMLTSDSDVTAPTDDAAAERSEPMVELYQPNKRRYIRERQLQGRFGLPRASLLPDYYALCGSKWGKVPKVPHLDEEMAVALLVQYGSLPKLLRQLNTIENDVLRKTLKHSISSIETSHRLSKLNADVPLPRPLEDLYTPPELENLTI